MSMRVQGVRRAAASQRACPHRKSERRVDVSLPFLGYSAPGALQQGPDRAVESLESATLYGRLQNLQEWEKRHA
jgi:hypothetical protein